MNLTDVSVIKPLMSAAGFNFSKQLGQNFIIDPYVCPEMARLCGANEESGVLEIGPGVGVLTAELARVAGKLVSVELDKRLLPVLKKTLAEFDNVEIVLGDILKLDLAEFIAEKFGECELFVCANLPYYITSPVIMLLLESRLPMNSITVMVQREAADRLCARVGDREAGAVTVAVNYYAEASKLFDVPSSSFMPAPKVDSSVIKLDIRKSPEVDTGDERFFFNMIRAAFSQRRKTAVNSISSGLSIDKSRVAQALRDAGLDENIRAEKLDMRQLAALSRTLQTK